MSEDPVASFAKGAIIGVLDWTEDKIKEYVVEFRNRKLAFIDDVETINTAKEQRKTSEWKVFKKYIDDSDLRILFQMGLTLRKLEKDSKRLESLREKIKNKYKRKGLHFAQFIQNGFFLRYYTYLLEKGITPEDLKIAVPNMLKNIENTVIFISQSDDEEVKTDQITSKIYAHSPNTFIICSTKSAMGKCEKIRKKVMKRITGYEFELYKTDIKEIYFLNKIEL
jgi:hypothetical protein